MPRYVERDTDGKIKGNYSLLQPGRAEELVEDNDPELVAFRAPPPKSAASLTTEELAAQMILDGTMTQPKIDAIKAAR